LINTVYIGLGSNLDNPSQQLNHALESLRQLGTVQNLVVSPFYRSAPVGPQDQPDFVNAVARFDTTLEPFDLLTTLQSLEHAQNRRRERHWGPRTLDLDILLFNNAQIQHPILIIPHAFMLERGFVIKPLADIAPDMLLSNGKTVAEHLRQLDTTDLVCL
jgi:2-amino-4-hydroxy-6-hydroxymethyldihydropteridine diphosphokinase